MFKRPSHFNAEDPNHVYSLMMYSGFKILYAFINQIGIRGTVMRMSAGRRNYDDLFWRPFVLFLAKWLYTEQFRVK